MKAKYKAKVNSVITKVRFLLLFSLLNLGKDMWSKVLSIKHSSKYFQHIKCEENME